MTTFFFGDWCKWEKKKNQRTEKKMLIPKLCMCGEEKL